jgi:tetratricopeptide (TPR) repeat protein
MKKQVLLIAALAAGLTACLTTPVVRPSIHIEPSVAAAGLSLDDRIAIQEAWNFIREGRTDKAEKIFARLNAANPFVAAGYGYIALIAGNLASAEDYLERSLEIMPDLTVSYLGLGQVYRKSGQDDQAYKMFLEALKRDPENEFAKSEADSLAADLTELALNDARRAEAAGETEQSKGAYLRALEYSPKLRGAHIALARIFIRDKDFHSAFLHLKAVGSEELADKSLLREFADALFQSGQWSRSLEIYEQIVSIDPQEKTAKDRIEHIKNRLGVVELPDQYGEIGAIAAIAKEDVAALIGVLFREVLIELNPKPQILVDITMSWAQRYIVKVAALEIMEVYSNHTFQPKKTINRAELAQVVIRLVNILKKNGFKILPQIPLERIQIADVPAEHFYHLSISQAVAYQLMPLGQDRAFKPELPVSGREAIRIFSLLADWIKSEMRPAA